MGIQGTIDAPETDDEEVDGDAWTTDLAGVGVESDAWIVCPVSDDAFVTVFCVSVRCRHG